jgi:hypothetical protein
MIKIQISENSYDKLKIVIQSFKFKKTQSVILGPQTAKSDHSLSIKVFF